MTVRKGIEEGSYKVTKNGDDMDMDMIDISEYVVRMEIEKNE